MSVKIMKGNGFKKSVFIAEIQRFKSGVDNIVVWFSQMVGGSVSAIVNDRGLLDKTLVPRFWATPSSPQVQIPFWTGKL